MVGTLLVVEGWWVLRLDRDCADAAHVLDLFGTLDLPTPFGASVPRETVVGELATLGTVAR